MLIDSKLKLGLAGLLVVTVLTLSGFLDSTKTQAYSPTPAPVVSVHQTSAGVIYAVDNKADVYDQYQPENRIWDYGLINDGDACDYTTAATIFQYDYSEGQHLYPSETEAGKRYCFRSGILLLDDYWHPYPGYIHAGYAASVVLKDITSPKIISITSSLANGSYGPEIKVPVEVIFSEPVFVYQQTPSLKYNSNHPSSGDSTVYLSGSSSNRLLFELSFSLVDLPIGDLNIVSVADDACSHPVDSGIEVSGEILPCLAIYAPIRDAAGNVADLRLPIGNNLADNKDIAMIAEIAQPPAPPQPPRQPKQLPDTGNSTIYPLIVISLVAAWLHRQLAISRAKR